MCKYFAVGPNPSIDKKQLEFLKNNLVAITGVCEHVFKTKQLIVLFLLLLIW